MMIILLLANIAAAEAEDMFRPCKRFKRWTECIVGRLADPKEDAAAKSFPGPPPDKSKVYIVRSSTAQPRMKVPVIVDGKPVADLAPQSYVVLTLNPGEHHFQSKTDNDTPATLFLESGKTYFLRQQLNLFLAAISGEMRPIDKEDGQSEVMQSKRVLSSGDAG